MIEGLNELFVFLYIVNLSLVVEIGCIEFKKYDNVDEILKGGSKIYWFDWKMNNGLVLYYCYCWFDNYMK